MCKIATFTNSKNITLSQIETIGNILLESEKDGFGYALKGESGVFGEKTVAKTFRSFFARQCLLSQFENILDTSGLAAPYGNYSKHTGPLIMHGRTSTNELGLKNCHPIIKQDHYLIHNGVVTDHGPNYETKTTTDSEHVLTRFIEGIESVEKLLVGYYAFSCITPDGKLHIVRDSIADLFFTYVESYDTYLFATTENLISRICYVLKTSHSPIIKVKDDIYMIFNGNCIEFSRKIKSRGFERRHAELAEKSLGRKLSTDDDEKDFESSVIDMTVNDDMKPLSDREFKLVLECLDSSYDIFSIRDNSQIDFEDFIELDYRDQKNYFILDQDGQIYFHDDMSFEVESWTI